VSSPKRSEFYLGIGKEAVISSVHCSSSRISRAAADHLRVVWISREEGLAELCEGEASVVSSVVASHEQLNFFTSGVDTDLVESLSNIVDGDVSSSSCVENVVGVIDIEILLVSNLDLGTLYFSFESALLPQ